MKMLSRSRGKFLLSISFALIAGLVFSLPAGAQTYVSAEPIPTGAVIGEANLGKLLSAGYSNLELWANRLLDECRTVDGAIDVLQSHGAIRTVNRANTKVEVAAGGYEGQTNPAFVFTIKDSGAGAVSAQDVGALGNAMGYVLSQDATVHFSPDNPGAYDFPLAYAVVSFGRNLSGLEAKAFFDDLGTNDPALWSGTFTGFTQIGNSMLFLQPKNGRDATATAGVAFSRNDWTRFPNGDRYISALGNVSASLLEALGTLRHQHLRAVSNLVKAIDKRTVTRYLKHRRPC